MHFWLKIFVGILFALQTVAAFAEEPNQTFSITAVWPNALRLEGEIDSRAALTFRRTIAANPQAKFVLLDSPGGDVQNGLLIADDVYTHGLSTVIPTGSICASACAYVFFAGKSRLVQGQLGVHQISGTATLANAQLNISDILDTLNKYGVDARIFPIMFRTASDDIHFFTQNEVKQYGIERLGLDDNQQAATASSPMAPTITSDPSAVKAIQDKETMAKNFVERLIEAGGLPPQDALNFASVSYASEVDFYGQPKTNAEIMFDKRKFFERWPNRSYQIRAGTLVANCADALCHVIGEFDWQVSSPQRSKHLSGTASFFYSLNMSAAIKVVSEGGKARK